MAVQHLSDIDFKELYLAPIEVERQKQIEKNQQKLKELGLLEDALVEKFKEKINSSKSGKLKKFQAQISSSQSRKLKRKRILTPLRKSKRIRVKVNYSQLRSTKMKKTRRNRNLRGECFEGLYPWMKKKQLKKRKL